MWSPSVKRGSPYTLAFNTTNMARADNMMKLRNRPRKGMQLALSSTAIAAIAQHNVSTLFFTLPAEIRMKIYELLCGGQFLHIELGWEGHKLKIAHTICQGTMSEEAADDLFHAETAFPWSVSVVKSLHDRCDINRGHAETISTTFLATCRHMYNEAKHIPYTTNTFSFVDRNTLDEFTKHLENSGSGHHLEIRRVHLSMTMATFDDEQRWRLAITQHLVPRFPEVQRVFLSLDQCYHAGVIGCRTPAEFEARQLSGNYVMSALLELRKLPLTHATFVISDTEALLGSHLNTDRDPIHYRWTLAEKQIWARYIKDSILQTENKRALLPSIAG